MNCYFFYLSDHIDESQNIMEQQIIVFILLDGIYRIEDECEDLYLFVFIVIFRFCESTFEILVVKISSQALSVKLLKKLQQNV